MILVNYYILRDKAEKKPIEIAADKTSSKTIKIEELSFDFGYVS